MKMDSELTTLLKATRRVSRSPRDLIRRAERKILKRRAALKMAAETSGRG